MKAPTRGERAADVLRGAMGSWWFVGAFVAFMAAWALTNTVLLGRVTSGKPFDKYPFIALNLILSMLAGLQGAIILISERRGEQLADRRQEAISLKLDDLIQVNKRANNDLIAIEESEQSELEEVKKKVQKKSPAKTRIKK